MTSLTRLSLANRLIVALVSIAIVVFGVLAARSLKQELLPSTQVPTAVVTAIYPGATPQIVADNVSTPIERAVSGVSGVTDVTSTSSNGQATISVNWEYGLDSDKVVSNIRNAVDSASQALPADVETDVITGSTDDIPVLLLSASTDLPLAASGELVQNVAVPALTAIEGVRQVQVTGEDTTQLTVTLRPAELTDRDLTAAAVTQTIQSQLTVVPAGTAYDKTLELAVQVGDSTNSVKQVNALSIPTSDGPVALSKIADVKVESISSSSLARANGRPALSVSVLKEADGDSVAISHAVADALPGLQKTMGNNAAFTIVFDQAPLIEQSIHDLTVEGALGLGFAVLVILLFLLSVRSTLITAISIPLSLLVAMIGLQVGGFSLNIFTLAALTVAVGRVVDDSIVVLENIKRRDTGLAPLTAGDIVASVKEVAGAVTASTATTVAVFLPVAVVSGVTGELFRPFAVTVAIALVASLIVSMTVVPVLAFWFLRGGKRKKAAVAAVTGATVAGATAAGAAPAVAATPDTAAEDETKVTRLQKGYLPVLNFGLAHPVITLALAMVIFVGTLGGATLLKTDFLGSVSDDSSLTIKQELPAGTRLDTMSAAAEKVETVLAADPDVKDYLTTIGGSIYAVAGTGANTAEITVNLAEGATADAVKPKLESQFAELGDTAGEITITQAANGSTSTDISVTVKGENSESLRKGSEQVQAALEGIPGLTNVTSNLAEQRKVLEVQVDHKKAADLGFTQAEVGQAVANALRGTKVGDVTLSGEQREVWVRTQDASDPSPADIGNLLLPVSQIQQAKAQEKASDKLEKRGDKLSDRQDALGDRQEEIGDEQQAKQDDATADSLDKLKESRADAVKSRSDLRGDLSKARKSLTKAKKALDKVQDSQPKPPTPTPGSQIPVTQLQFQYTQELQTWQSRLSGAAAGVGQAEAGIKQLESGIEQSDKGIDQLDEQIDGIRDQQADTAESRQTQQELTDEQKAIADGQKELAEDQQDLADLRAGAIRVKSIADVTLVLAPTTVTQIDGDPSVTITATPDTSDLGALSATVTTTLAGIPDLPAGVSAELGGAATDQQEAFAQLGLAMLVAIALVFLIMVGTFRSLIQPLILMVAIPFAATGAIAGLLITDTPLGVPSMVGLLMLIGIVVTNAIVLIDLINQYRAKGEDLKTAIVDGARLRLRPIIMTATATIFALIPMGLGLTGGGAFISQPLAIVVIGGLVSSTVLTLLLVPVLYSLVERRSEKKRLRSQTPVDPDATQPQPAV
ncbi:efflux RND transporter permease subunit [Microlunatus aurantiacus]|uniref:efflux RND transporter permease subunit n=1 Tax=Microlunatus aurantiacus TaxID=446786 RepID=UPI0031E306B6